MDGDTPGAGAFRDAEGHGLRRTAVILGVLGLLPFVALAAGLRLLPTDARAPLATALTAYGAVILSFMGAIYWGLAMAWRERPAARWLWLGVVPALVAWGALLLAPPAGSLLLAAAFALVYSADVAATRSRLAPRWYLHLRMPLTLTVVACLLAAAGALDAAPG